MYLPYRRPWRTSIFPNGKFNDAVAICIVIWRFLNSECAVICSHISSVVLNCGDSSGKPCCKPSMTTKITKVISLIARLMGPTWGPSGDDRTQVGPMLAPRTLLSGMFKSVWWSCWPLTPYTKACMVMAEYGFSIWTRPACFMAYGLLHCVCYGKAMIQIPLKNSFHAINHDTNINVVFAEYNATRLLR